MSHPNLPTPEICWQAVLTRDSQFDGQFYFGVRSTGVYCKPSCKSRQPRRSQVSFYPDPETAESAGFRPCKRCQPDRPLSANEELAARACALLDAADGPLPLAELGRQLGLSPAHLQRVFKASVGVSPHQYAAARRLERFKRQARQSTDVASAQYAAGYGSARGLYERAETTLGMTPDRYRRGGAGMVIHYVISACPLGQFLLAATDRGVCAVRFGDDAAVLEDNLRQEFPAAALERTPAGLEPWLQMLKNYFSGQPLPAGINLDVRATPFQLRVWEALQAIPYGQTLSYAGLASAIGQPKAVRAVANACASNPAAVFTPCHRVVRSDGSLGGYRWGLARKQTLLEHEKSAVKETGYG